jgi:predicted enzyme related to lactoylglutathione lyase
MATPTLEEHALAAGRAFPWHECYTPNKQKTIEFYTKALGMGTEEYDMGVGSYTMLKVNGTAVAGIMDTSEPPLVGMDVPPHWAVYLAVDDVDARIDKCKALGAKVVHGPMDIPKVGRMVLIQDPQGAHLWLFKPEM